MMPSSARVSFPRDATLARAFIGLHRRTSTNPITKPPTSAFAPADFFPAAAQFSGLPMAPRFVRARICRRIRLCGHQHATECDMMRQFGQDWRWRRVKNRKRRGPFSGWAPRRFLYLPQGVRKAEREGFEPSVDLRPHRFSRPARSAAPAPLRIQETYYRDAASLREGYPLAPLAFSACAAGPSTGSGRCG
jgi:hypothetical protein